MEEDANIHECIVEQTAGVPVPQINEEIVESVQTVPRVIPQERIWCIFEAEEYREVVKVTPPELGSEHIVEKIADLSVPWVVKENLDVIKAVPQEHISERKTRRGLQRASASDPGTYSGSRGDHSAGAHPGTYHRTGSRCTSASDPGTNSGSRGDHSPGAHIGAYTDTVCRCASATDLGRARRGGEGWFRSPSCTSGPNSREDL